MTVYKRTRGARQAAAAVEIGALRGAIAYASAHPEADLGARWAPSQRPLTASVDSADASGAARARKPPVTLEDRLLLAWQALRASEGRRLLVACLQGAGFVCALALHLITGRPGIVCAQLVQRACDSALANADMLERLAVLPARRAYQPTRARRPER
jgi:hypothetical protein